MKKVYILIHHLVSNLDENLNNKWENEEEINRSGEYYSAASVNSEKIIKIIYEPVKPRQSQKEIEDFAEAIKDCLEEDGVNDDDELFWLVRGPYERNTPFKDKDAYNAFCTQIGNFYPNSIFVSFGTKDSDILEKRNFVEERSDPDTLLENMKSFFEITDNDDSFKGEGASIILSKALDCLQALSLMGSNIKVNNEKENYQASINMLVSMLKEFCEGNSNYEEDKESLSQFSGEFRKITQDQARRWLELWAEMKQEKK